MGKPFIISLEGGSGLSFCDIECFHTYSYYVEVDHLMTGKKLKPSDNICFHCASCGGMIFTDYTTDCVMHGDKCPRWVWYASYPTMVDFKEGLEELLGITSVSTKIYDTADAVAEANPFVSGFDLAYLTINVLGNSESDESGAF